MKYRIVFEPRPGAPANGFELEAAKVVISESNGWLQFSDQAGALIVGYAPGVVRSVANVGALVMATAQPKAPEATRENPRRQQEKRQATAS